MHDKNKELIIKAQQGDKYALEQIIEFNKGLIWSIVKRFIGRGYDVDDLYQIACIGFIEAVQRFSFEHGTELSTYAVQYMIGEIKKFLRDDGIIRVSRSIKELGFKIKELEREYFTQSGESISIKKISEILEVPEENIYIAMDASKTVESINEEESDDGREKIERISNNIDEQTKIVDKITIREMIRNLNKRDREIIKLRYFKDKTQTQVAKILGISQVHVSRIEKRILNDFRNKLVV